MKYIRKSSIWVSSESVFDTLVQRGLIDKYSRLEIEETPQGFFIAYINRFKIVRAKSIRLVKRDVMYKFALSYLVIANSIRD